MNLRTLSNRFIFSLILLFSQTLYAQNKAVSLSSLTQDEMLDGFKVTALYLNDADQPMGARLIHVTSGFTLDLLQIESVPQTFIYVNTYPVSDKGEPHTQEHLLITKGNKGHELNTREGMSMAQSSAFTAQLHTAYFFNTGAGPDVFYTLFEKYVDALLYPDYTDEEVRREVRNWGVVESPDKSYRLEEKGAVYNEMSSTMNNPYSLMYDTIGRLLYGNTHPMAYNAGGLPADIRILTEKDIIRFHKENYLLNNMGAIVSLPSNMSLQDVLGKMNQILLKLDQGAAFGIKKLKDLPMPQTAESGKIALVNVPAENAQQPGSMLLAYPPDLQLGVREYLELSNFITIFAGDATTNLYKIFVDSKTKLPGMDAQSVYGYVEPNQLHPVYIGLDGINPENLTAEKAKLVRERILHELEKIAAYPDHSPELLAFNKRYETNLISTVRSYAKFVNSPPKFGFRNTGDDWYNQLELLSQANGFKKSIGLKPQIQEIRARLATGKNIWKEDITNWKLTSTSPFVVVTHADPSLNQVLEKSRKQRADEEVSRLKMLYHLNGDQETILRFKNYYDSNTVVLEKLEEAHRIKFIDNPPLTIDDQLHYAEEKLNGRIPVVASIFNNMTSATTGIAINLKTVSKNQLVYLALLPELLTQTGYIKNGKGITYEEMIQQIQQQILSLNSYYGTSQTTGRVELIVKAAGNNESEAALSLDWISNVLNHPYWKKENLPRIRDLLEQQLSTIRKKMQDPEETWVFDPGFAYRRQNHPLFLATSSFLTRSQNIFRLKWMLKTAGSKTDSIAISRFLNSLSGASAKRDQLNKLLTLMVSEKSVPVDSAGLNSAYAKEYYNLPKSAKTLARDAAVDLTQMLNEIPDNSLDTDWKYLCKTMQQGLAQGPLKTLNDLNVLRESILNQNNTRVFLISSDQTKSKLNPALLKLVSSFKSTAASDQDYYLDNIIDQRVQERMHINERIVFAGLINPDSHTGVFMNAAPVAAYKDTQRLQLLRFLAAELYAGGGKQSVYTKTTGAGLSYSTGIGVSPSIGMYNYYAERTPELPQTLQFVINEIKRSPTDTAMLDYVVSLAVGAFRSADDYETRGEAMAVDLTDGRPPALIKNFRESILNLRKEPGLIYEIYHYKDSMYQNILPGYGIPSRDVPGGLFFVIGPEKQMAAYEAYLKSVNGSNTELFRLYPRDFWMIENNKN